MRLYECEKLKMKLFSLLFFSFQRISCSTCASLRLLNWADGTPLGATPQFPEFELSQGECAMLSKSGSVYSEDCDSDENQQFCRKNSSSSDDEGNGIRSSIIQYLCLTPYQCRFLGNKFVSLSEICLLADKNTFHYFGFRGQLI